MQPPKRMDCRKNMILKWLMVMSFFGFCLKIERKNPKSKDYFVQFFKAIWEVLVYPTLDTPM